MPERKSVATRSARPRATPNRSASPAMSRTRPDRASASEPDARHPGDRDGNEGHARAIGAKGKLVRNRPSR